MSNIRATYPLSSQARVEIVQGDLTQERVDAIVNAANSHLAHGGGVAGAIIRAGGWSIQQESDEWVRQHGPVSNSSPAYTNAGKLPARYVIHAVGPIWGEGDEDRKLADAVRGSLRLASQLELKSIAFPAISTGIFGFPKQRAAQIFFTTLNEFFKNEPASGLEQVRITLLDMESLQIFLEEGQHSLGEPD